MSSLVLSLLSRWALAAHHKAGREMHMESAHPAQFSSGEASPGPDKWETPWGRADPQASGLRGLGAGHLELPASSVIPAVSFLYFGKAKFHTHTRAHTHTHAKKNLNYLTSEIAQSCPTLCDPMDCSPPSSSIHGIFQAGVLEWVAISFPGVLPNPGIEPWSPTL